jgi:hypothetical protein
MACRCSLAARAGREGGERSSRRGQRALPRAGAPYRKRAFPEASARMPLASGLPRILAVSGTAPQPSRDRQAPMAGTVRPAPVAVGIPAGPVMHRLLGQLRLGVRLGRLHPVWRVRLPAGTALRGPGRSGRRLPGTVLGAAPPSCQTLRGSPCVRAGGGPRSEDPEAKATRRPGRVFGI